MRKVDLEQFIGNEKMFIVDAMKKIDENVKGILFVTDNSGKLCGSLTDGDIRRWIINTGDLSADISKIMNKNPQYLSFEKRRAANKVMKEYEIKALPLVNDKIRIVDILFNEEKDVSGRNSFSNEMRGVPVVIMAGGKGTRLYPYTKILPKPLIPIGDVPILERIMNRFFEYGVVDFYMTVNYKKSMIKSYFSELKPEYSIKYIEEEKPLGTGGSLRLIGDKFEKPVIVTNCDILIDADYTKMYEYHEKSGHAMTIVTAMKNLEIPYGVVHPSERGIIASMEEKPKLSYLINTGMYIIEPELVKRIPKDRFYHMTDLADDLMNNGKTVGMYPISEDSFLDMGEFEEMKRMEAKLNLSSEN